MTQTTAHASVTSQTIAVEHIRISSGRPFAEVRRKLEGTVPKLDTGMAEALGSGDQQRANDYENDLRRARSWRVVADCGQKTQRAAV
jgi:ethanolamine utilization microcompartment shell protein EutL